MELEPVIDFITFINLHIIRIVDMFENVVHSGFKIVTILELIPTLDTSF